jgi:hypothetical protein
VTTVRWLEAALRSPPATRRLAVAGWLLYAISWLTPSADGRQLGAAAFVQAVRFGCSLIVGETAWGLPLGVGVLLGWLANFSIVLRLPTWARIVSIATPWLSFAIVLAMLPVRPTLAARAAFFLYFYPWAVGIALIHAANIATRRGNGLKYSLQ